MSTEDKTSEGGSTILRHAAAGRPFGVAEMDAGAHEAIDAHLRAFVGEAAEVFHELVSDIVHIDVHIIAPSSRRDCYTLVTSGMSDLPMTTPQGAEELRYAELLISLPKTWMPGSLSIADLQNESLYWPIRLLKQLARLPHEYNTWLGYGHTIPNGNPPAPYASDTELCGAMVMPAITLGPRFATLAVRPDKTIHFYAVVPLYESEMTFKLKKGADALVKTFFDASVTEILDPTRRLAVRKKRFLFF